MEGSTEQNATRDSAQMTGAAHDPELLDAVRRQIEYYFSKENLQNDKYLASQMDAHMSVPISVIMKFAKLKALTQDEEVVKTALVDSAVTVVDNKIKANIKASGRSTIILRDIPTDAPESEIREIFNFPGCKNICSVRGEIGDTWFVVMDTEEDAKETVIALRDNKRTFRGRSVKARVKTEAVVRSYFPTNVAAVPPALSYPVMPPFTPLMPGATMDGMMLPYFVPVPPIVDPAAASTTAAPGGAPGAEQDPATTAASAGTSDEAGAAGAGKGAGYGKKSAGASKTTGRRTGTEGTATGTRRPPRDPRDKEHSNAASSTGAAGAAAAKDSRPPIEVNAVTFPPLGGADERPIPTPGYKGDFQKYSFEEIIMIVKSVKEASLPASMNPRDHLTAMTPEINMDLLKRQRTFTIDETREQLRLGRPVQREAILPGAVDYRSMMYGDRDSDAPSSHATSSAPSQPATASATAGSSASSHAAAQAAGIAAVSQEAGEEVARPTTPPTTTQASGSAPTSPARMSAASWAAMVRSTALMSPSAPESLPAVPRSTPKPTTPATASKAKESKAADKEEGKKERRKPRLDKETKDKAQSTEPAADSQTPASDASATVSRPAGEHQLNALAPTWGGKASFAAMLKQSGTDGSEILAARPPAPPATSSTPSKDKDAKARTGTAASNGVYTNNRRNNSSSNSSSSSSASKATGGHRSGADSEGMWAKESLPALPEK